jgi:hypothetical protein
LIDKKCPELVYLIFGGSASSPPELGGNPSKQEQAASRRWFVNSSADEIWSAIVAAVKPGGQGCLASTHLANDGGYSLPRLYHIAHFCQGSFRFGRKIHEAGIGFDTKWRHNYAKLIPIWLTLFFYFLNKRNVIYHNYTYLSGYY